MKISASRTVFVLCSGFGLGMYVPGLLISEKLRRIGFTTEVEVFESLLPEAKIQMVERSRDAYHRSFRVALTSQKVPADARGSVDPQSVEALLKHWREADARHFICLSGHWIHLLDLYRERLTDGLVEADLIYLDADLPPSWMWLRKLKPDYANGYREVRLYDRARQEVAYSIDTNSGPPLPYASRSKRLVVHGGGWGIGTFEQRIPEIESTGYALDVVCYAKSEAATDSRTRRYFLDDPSWRTWHRNDSGELTFPPFASISSSTGAVFKPQIGSHGIHRVIRSALGLVSKPGGGTLIDSFGSATPLIMLEPFGPHEECNARVWRTSRFGVPYQAWADAGYPTSVLEEMHINLLARHREVRDYVETYAETVPVTD